MQKKRRQIILEKLNLTSPQKANVLLLLASQKNKYRKLLHEAHERMHIIADLTSSLEFWLNVDGRYEHISAVCEKLTGYTAAQFFDNSISMEQLIHPESRRRFLFDRKGAMAGKSGTEVEYKFIRKDGEERWALASWRPVFTRRGKQIGVRISISDITRLKEAEAEAAANRIALERLSGGRENSAGFSVGTQGNVTRWTEAARRIFGYEENDAKSLFLADLLTTDTPVESLLRPDEEAPKPFPARFLRADGSVFHAEILTHAVRDSEGRITCHCIFVTADGESSL